MSQVTFQVQVGAAEAQRGDGALSTTFYTYPISMTLPGVDRVLHCKRRYADFFSLREQLTATYWYCIVPPLPEKETVQDRLYHLTPVTRTKEAKSEEKELLVYRQSAFSRFLKRTAAHPTLGGAVLLRHFLIDEEWQRCVREPVKLPEYLRTSVGKGLIAKSFSSDAMGMGGAGSLGAAVGDEAAGSAYAQMVGGAEMTDAALAATAEYLANLGRSIADTRDRFQALAARRRQTADTLKGFADALGALAEGEEDKALATEITATKAVSLKIAELNHRQADEEVKSVVATLSYYVGACKAATETLTHVLNGLRERNHLITRARDMEANQQRPASTAAMEAQANLQRINDAAQRLDRDLSDAKAVLQAEFAKFHQDKQYDMRGLLRVFGNLEIHHASGMKQEWENLRPTIEKLGN